MKQYFYSAIIFKKSTDFNKPDASICGLYQGKNSKDAYESIVSEIREAFGNEVKPHFTSFHEVN